LLARVLGTEHASNPIANDRAIFESHPWTRIDADS
jgi:hypothetical protein